MEDSNRCVDNKMYNVYWKFITEEDTDIEELIEAIEEFINRKGKSIEYSIEEVEYRICDVCGSTMEEGYMIEGGFGYWCSDDCLEDSQYTEKEIEEMRESEDLFYTEWY